MTRPPGEAESRPVIVTVDDDPSVSRAVARDLRRRYGEKNRIVRAESGEQALDALRQMKLRGDQVAVILADYRMPGLTGIEFLERAMDIYPYARRVLLTAYADTSAAIDAINVVDLDHYLLKPWDPPEEKLYPVIDELLRAWQRTERRPVREAKLIGHRWSAPSAELRDFLARNQVPYRWYASDSAEGGRLLEAAGTDGTRLPVLVTADGEPLIEPSRAEVAAKVGLATLPGRGFYDLVVIGGGPAGLGAAVYGASEGLRTILVEKFATGGQAGQSSRIENYLGFPDGLSGGQLTDRARRQAVKFGAELLTTCEATSIEVNGPARTVHFSDGSAVDAKSVILAMGVAYRQLEAPGCADMTGAGIYYGAALTEAESCKDQDVYIVGGANSAGQSAVYLSRFARSVTLLVRANSLEQSMSYYLVQQIAGIENITIRTCTEVVQAHGAGHLEQLTLRDMAAGTTEIVDAGQLFIFIGAAPRTAWLDGVVARDMRGFVLAGPDFSPDEAEWPLDRPPYHLETSVPGVFVAGDVRAESAKRVASAVGEGAMAVMFVHRYLESV
jgi:thioredoxin reductase (NADPH)